MEVKEIHRKALQLAKTYKDSEIKLLEILQIVNRHKVWKKMGFTSLFKYCEEALELTAEQAYRFNGVAKKCEEIPKLKKAISDGTLNISVTRRIVSVVKKDNVDEWIDKASTLSQRELEKEVARVNPKEALPTTMKILSEEMANLNTCVDMDVFEMLENLRDLYSQKTGKACGVREVIEHMTRETFKRMDPVQKAKRNINKPGKKEAILYSRIKSRVPRHTHLNHQLALRDKGQCTEISANGKRCTEKRWLQVHHIVPVSHGGTNDIDNLATLCFRHHQLRHEGVQGVPSLRVR